MASQNVETVRRLFEAFDEGNLEGFLDLLADDVDWRVTGYLTGDRHLRGKDAVRAWLLRVAALQASGEEIRMVQDEYRDLDERTVLVLGSGTIRRDEGLLEEQLGWIYRIEEGKVAYMADYLSREEAIAAAEELGEG